jgi:hypothetical protein
MKRFFYTSLFVSLVASATSCSDNKAAGVMVKSATAAQTEKSSAPVKTDGEAIGAIETENYVLKLHRAFAYEPNGSKILTGMKPKAGHKFIYLDVSLKNKSAEKLDGGFLFIALRVTDAKGTEYKKPAAGLAAYSSEHPEENNDDEYAALWETFKPNEFHREIVYAVEVPAAENNFVLHLPTDRKRKEWQTLSFSL